MGVYLLVNVDKTPMKEHFKRCYAFINKIWKLQTDKYIFMNISFSRKDNYDTNKMMINFIVYKKPTKQKNIKYLISPNAA